MPYPLRRPALRTTRQSECRMGAELTWAPAGRRVSVILRPWNSSSPGRWPTLMTVEATSSSSSIDRSESWLPSSRAAVASSITMMAGFWMSRRQKAMRWRSPPESTRSQSSSSWRRLTM